MFLCQSQLQDQGSPHARAMGLMDVRLSLHSWIEQRRKANFREPFKFLLLRFFSLIVQWPCCVLTLLLGQDSVLSFIGASYPVNAELISGNHGF